MAQPTLFRTEADLAAEQARKDKAERLKSVGAPISLSSKPLAIVVRDDEAWVAENGGLLRRTLLKTGKTIQTYRGHEGPVTSIAFIEHLVITGSWDETIRVWDTNSAQLLSTTKAHKDFIKALLVIPSLRILASGSSDKTIRFWDLSEPDWHKSPLKALGSLSGFTRPVTCLAADENSFTCTRLFTSDSKGELKVWTLERRYAPGRGSCRAVFEAELPVHKTGINDMAHVGGVLWTASTDTTVRVHQYPRPKIPCFERCPVLEHDKPVTALLALPRGQPVVVAAVGDNLYTYIVNDIEEPRLAARTEAHAHDITGLACWVRTFTGEKPRAEIWVVSASLDGTLRRWSLRDLLRPPPPPSQVRLAPISAPMQKGKASSPSAIKLTEEEERELAELMGSAEESSDSSAEGSQDDEVYSVPGSSSSGEVPSARAFPATLAGIAV